MLQLRSFGQVTGLFTLGWLVISSSTSAQVLPDTSLVEPSLIDIEGELIRITGGTTAGTNLFHSFAEFSVPTNNTAFFDNAIAIDNIISRVTGGRISNIDGLIRANGTANLFLINPSGIVFGPNARLDIGGSFFGSTASSINFADGTQFSAIDPQPVLTVNVPIGLQYGSNTGNLEAIGSQLQVPDNRTLALFGGSVSLDNAQLIALGGRIELGGFADGGIVGLDADGSANIPIGIPRRDVTIANTSILDVTAGGGGNISLTGGNISLLSNSNVFAGIAENLGAPDAVAGNIVVNAIGSTVLDASSIANNVEASATGNGGNILVDSTIFTLQNNSALDAGTFGTGNAGNVGVQTTGDITLQDSSIFSDATLGDGDTGSIAIVAGGTLTATNSQIRSDAVDTSNPDAITEGIAGSISLLGTRGVAITNSTVSSESNNSQEAGFSDISIASEEGSVEIANSTLSSSNLGTSLAGDLLIDARDRVSIANSRLTSNGEQGQIVIGSQNSVGLPSSPQQTAIANSTLTTQQFGQGTAGNLILNASDRVEIADSSLLSDAFSEPSESQEPVSGGSAGKIEVSGRNRITVANSIISSESDNTNTEDLGNLGDIRLTAAEGSVSLTQATVSTSNFGTGFAGDLIVSAIEDVTISQGSQLLSNGNFGRVAIGTFDLDAATLPLPATVLPRRIAIDGESRLETNNDVDSEAADVSPDVPLDAGNIIMGATEQIAIAGNSTIQSLTNRLGNAGYILLQGETADISISNSTLLTSVNENGNGVGGTLSILARSLSLSDNAQIDAGTFGIGDAGDIFIQAEGPVSLAGNDTRIFSDVTSSAQGSGGVISIAAQSLSLSGGAALETSTLGDGNAGDTFINVRDRVSLNSQSRIRSNGESTGDAGNISVTADRLELDNAAIEASTVSGTGGDIIVNVRGISRLRNGSQFSTNAGTIGDSGDGGNIILDTEFLVGSENSDITANSFEGFGGFIQLNSEGVFGLQAREQLTPKNDITAFSQRNPDLGGFIEINSPEVDTSGIISLPENVVDVTALVGQDPCTAGKRSEFLITGRGGLPPNPSDPLSAELDTVEWVNPDPLTEGGLQSRHHSAALPPISPTVSPRASFLVEATGWRVSADGSIDLVSRASRVTPVSPSLQPPQSCR
jgi:filamentous hemagglutinin family protein